MLRTTKYRHLFFDLDHTLWDFDANAKQTLTQLYYDCKLESLGVHDFDVFYQSYLLHNEKWWSRYRNGFIKVDELRWKRMWHTLLDFKIRDEHLARTMGLQFLQQLPQRTLLFPGTVDTLRYLQNKGYGLHLITNGFEETQHKKLQNSGIDGFFMEVVTSESCSSVKPKREIFEYALKKANALPHHSIMIGDSIEVDVMGAINAGIDQVYVNHTQATCTIRPTFTVATLMELQAIF